MGELLDRLRQMAPVDEVLWKPADAGEGIEGLIVSWEHRTPDPAKRITDYPILHLATDSGAVVWHAAAQVAQDELVRTGAMVGDRIAILFLGKHRTQNRNEVERWRVLVDPGRRHRMRDTVNAIDDVELRHRVRRTFARIYGQTTNLTDDRLDDAERWLNAAIAGTEDLDPIGNPNPTRTP